MDTLDRIISTRVKLLMTQPFIGTLSLRLELEEDCSIQTMEVDGTTIFYNSIFVESLKDSELEGLIFHEVLHCTNGHIWRRKNRSDKKKWNYACDFSINPIILESGFSLPAGGCIDPAFHGLPSEKIYNMLPDSKECSSIYDGVDFGGMRNPKTKNTSELQAQEIGWKIAVKQAAKAAKMQGKLSKQLECIVKESLKPVVDWKALLRRFVQENARNDYTWKYPRMRYIPLGLYMPDIRSEQMPALALFMDMSGSMSIKKEIAASFAEVQSIVDECQPERVYIGYVDSKLQRVDIFEKGEPLKLKCIGRGGTDFRPAFDWVLKELQDDLCCMIYLTDSHGTFPSVVPSYPVLWAYIVGENSRTKPAPFGEVIEVKCV